MPTDIVVLVVRWRARYKLSLRNLAEMYLDRGFVLTHETVRESDQRFAALRTAQLRTKRLQLFRDVKCPQCNTCVVDP